MSSGRSGAARHSLRWRSLAAGLLMLALASVSTAATAIALQTQMQPRSGVAVAGDQPVLQLPTPLRGQTVRAPAPTAIAPAGCVSVPIVYYHYIRTDTNPHDPGGMQLSVSPMTFQAQMDWLRSAGGHPVTLADVMNAINGGRRLPPHPVVLTFDDGHNDFATRAVPVLLRDGFVATTFVVPGFLGQPSYMTQEQVLQVAADGMIIGAHTMHHVNLTSLSRALAWSEIATSKSILEHLIGRSVLDFAYPYGAENQAVEEDVANAGFRDAVATTWGTEQCLAGRYALHRFEIRGSDNLAAFATDVGVLPPPPGWIDPALAAPTAGAKPAVQLTPAPSR
jgi:peptidoglycan/xylan/chitin deacetylase (PgdA/CDA1 family)